MWEKIKNWISRLLDLDRDGKITSEDLEVARAIADQTLKDANEMINDAVDGAQEVIEDVKKTVKKVTKKKK
jgi:hypothetical protein